MCIRDRARIEAQGRSYIDRSRALVTQATAGKTAASVLYCVPAESEHFSAEILRAAERPNVTVTNMTGNAPTGLQTELEGWTAGHRYVEHDWRSAFPAQEGSFDLIIAWAMVHCAPEPSLLIRDIGRLLRSAGRVLVADSVFSSEARGFWTLFHNLRRHRGTPLPYQRLPTRAWHTGAQIDEALLEARPKSPRSAERASGATSSFAHTAREGPLRAS